MLDPVLRRALSPALDRTGSVLADRGVPPLALTGGGLAAGLGAAVAAAQSHWWTALILWLINRLLDGLDGPVARRRGSTELGGFLDLVADFTVYAAFVVGVAVAVPSARLACLVLLVAYYVSGTAFLTLSSMLERRGDQDVYDDGRSLRFVTGLAEGSETVIAYVLICLFPEHAGVLVWAFAVIVGLTAVQRVALGVRLLHRPQSRQHSGGPR